MKFSRLFDLSSYLVFLTGIASVWMAGGLGGLELTLVLVILALTWRFGPLQLSRLTQYLAVGLLMLLFGFDTVGLSGFSDSTVHLMLGLGLYKALTRNGASDYVVFYLVSFSLLLTASTYTLSIHFLAALLLFVLLSVFTFILLENRPAYLDRPNARVPVFSYLAVAATLTSLTVLLAIPIFLAVPRVALGWMDAENSRMAGFSQSVDLGEIGGILNNAQVVMRVSVNREPEQLPADLKWRGIALDRFDGKSWISTRPMVAELAPDPEGRHLVAVERRQREILLEQVFTVEPFTDVLFAADSPIQFAGFRSARFRLAMDGNGTFLLRPRPAETIRYFVHSDLRSRAEQLRSVAAAGTFPEDLREAYLALPELDPRVPALAREATQGLSTPLHRAMRLEQFLKNSFRYTLSNPSGGSADPLADFLFESRAGHCEYFATAHAVLLRTLGVPARVVNGFRSGQFNHWGNYFIVRQSDAHSWVEAWFPGAGWVEFDPTPAAGASEFALMRWATLVVDTIDMLWGEVVTFDRWKQLGLFSRLRAGIEEQLERSGRAAGALVSGLTGMVRSPGRYLGPALEWFLVVTVLALAFRLCRGVAEAVRRWVRRKRRRHSPAEVAQVLYLEFSEHLARKGFRRARGETPAEYADRLARELGSEVPATFTRLYYRLRFGGGEPEPVELESASLLLKELRLLKSTGGRELSATQTIPPGIS